MNRLIILLLLPIQVFAQAIPDSIAGKIDYIFRSFTAKSPGCAVAVIKNGETVFTNGYGMANLEYAIPNTPKTIFHIASESKQYVAFCMLLLEKEGKLTIDDDIRKHLDYVPDFGHTITIRQLIHHTSGLRDQWQLLANAGWQLDDVITQEHVIKLVSKQKALNFLPGEEYNYCNTGYTLMAEIVKKVSGLSLRQYADKYIFKPLGMNDTHFHDNYQEIVPGRSYSYAPQGGGFQHSVLSYSIVGATSLFTTVEDEAKWLMNYETGTVGGKDLVEKMYQVGVLNDGRKLNYAFAINIDRHKGWKEIGHGGGDAGYRTYACRYPENNLGVVVFSNSAVVIPALLARQVADIFITEEKESPKKDSVSNYADSVFLKKLPGRYFSERGDQLELYWQNGKLSRRGSGNNTYRFIPISRNKFSLPDGGPSLLVDDKNLSRDSMMEITLEFNSSTIHYKRQPANLAFDINDYTGRYYNDETEAFYSVTTKDGKLQMEHRKYYTVALRSFAPDQFNLSYWWMNHIRFIRNKKGKVIAFEVNAGRLQHLRYEKLKQ